MLFKIKELNKDAQVSKDLATHIVNINQAEIPIPFVPTQSPERNQFILEVNENILGRLNEFLKDRDAKFYLLEDFVAWLNNKYEFTTPFLFFIAFGYTGFKLKDVESMTTYLCPLNHITTTTSIHSLKVKLQNNINNLKLLTREKN